jgi:hypothetical protein
MMIISELGFGAEKSLKKVAKKDEKNLVVQKKAVPLQSRSENERVF